MHCVGMQGYEDDYVTGTCRELLKWKFAHLNSVDFLLQLDEQGEGACSNTCAFGRLSWR